MSDCPAKNTTAIEALYESFGEPDSRLNDFQCQRDIIDFPYVVSYLSHFLSDMLQHPEYFSAAVQDLLKNKTPHISVMSNTEQDKQGYLPTIGIEFNGAQIKQNFGFDSRMSYDIRTGVAEYYAEWVSNYTISVIAKSMYETFLLGTSIARCLLYAREPIKKVLRLKSFQVPSISKAQPRSEDGSIEGYVLQVSVAMLTPEQWEVQAEEPILKRNDIVATTN